MVISVIIYTVMMMTTTKQLREFKGQLEYQMEKHDAME